jgi:GAF domain-containing protein
MLETPRHAMAERHVRSQLLVPVLLRGTFWGYVGFEDQRQERTWTATEQSLLLALAGSLATTLSGRVIEEQVAARDSLLRGVAVSTGAAAVHPGYQQWTAQGPGRSRRSGPGGPGVSI